MLENTIRSALALTVSFVLGGVAVAQPEDTPETLQTALDPCIEHLPEVADSEYLYTEFDPPNLTHAYRGVPQNQLDKVVAVTADAGGFAVTWPGYVAGATGWPS